MKEYRIVATRETEHGDGNWMIEKARKMDNNELKDWIWMAVNGQPIPGCLEISALRLVLIERGEDGTGYHNT